MQESTHGDTTVTVQGAPEDYFVDSSLEILLCLPQGGQRRIPLQLRALRLTPRPQGPNDFAIADGPSLSFSWQAGRLFFSNESDSIDVWKNQTVCHQGELKAGDELSWKGHQAKIWDRLSQRRATLECYSEPFAARVWPIDEGPILIGRPGRRSNHLVLEHPTVSREHATVFWSAAGPTLVCESPRALVMVDGRRVEASDQSTLRDGALVQLGEMVFRFRLLPEPMDEEHGEQRLYISSLGGFVARVGKRGFTEKSWRTQAIRWLLARLAWEWGRPLSVDVMLEEFWPDQSPERAKNNLNFSLSTLRQMLRGEEDLNFITRSNSAIQLQPELLGRHDVTSLLELLAQAGEWAQRDRVLASNYFQRAVRLYSGDYLVGCYMDWASGIRASLREQTLSGGRFALSQLEATGDAYAVIEFALHLLGLDKACQASHATLIRAYTDLGQIQRALEQYQMCQQATLVEMDAPPDPEVGAAYQAALARS